MEKKEVTHPLHIKQIEFGMELRFLVAEWDIRTEDAYLFFEASDGGQSRGGGFKCILEKVWAALFLYTIPHFNEVHQVFRGSSPRLFLQNIFTEQILEPRFLWRSWRLGNFRGCRPKARTAAASAGGRRDSKRLDRK